MININKPTYIKDIITKLGESQEYFYYFALYEDSVIGLTKSPFSILKVKKNNLYPTHYILKDEFIYASDCIPNIVLTKAICIMNKYRCLL